MSRTNAANTSWYSPVANPSSASMYPATVFRPCFSGEEFAEDVGLKFDALDECRTLMANWLTGGGANIISPISSGVVPRQAAALCTAAGLQKNGLLSAPAINATTRRVNIASSCNNCNRNGLILALATNEKCYKNNGLTPALATATMDFT